MHTNIWSMRRASAAAVRATALAAGVGALLGAWTLAAGPAAAQAPAAPQIAQAAPAAEDPLYAERVLGSPDAPVEIIEYSSLTCPHCANFHANILPELKREYIDTGRVKIVYRDFPFDRAALGAAMTARCMAPERYFPFLDGLFRTQGQWAGAQDPARALQQSARLAGLNEQQFNACLQNQQLADFILQRRLDAEQRFQVRSTPTFIFNGGAERIVGAQPIEQFRAVIDRLAPPRG